MTQPLPSYDTNPDHQLYQQENETIEELKVYFIGRANSLSGNKRDELIKKINDSYKRISQKRAALIGAYDSKKERMQKSASLITEFKSDINQIFLSFQSYEEKKAKVNLDSKNLNLDIRASTVSFDDFFDDLDDSFDDLDDDSFDDFAGDYVLPPPIESRKKDMDPCLQSYMKELGRKRSYK